MNDTPLTDQKKIFELIRAVGQAALTRGIENSHSGNISIKCRDERGNDCIAITATGSQKGELTPDKICFPSLDKINYGHFKSSSETDIHAIILRMQGVNASIHGHTKTATVITLDDAPMPKQNPRAPMIPIDPLGARYLGEIPVDWFAVASGSKEMAETVAKRLESNPACIVQTHGAFARGATVQEALFYLCLIEHSGEVIFFSDILGVDPVLARKTALDLVPSLRKELPEYSTDLDDKIDFDDEPETVELFSSIGFRIFESRYSPFHTGSMSIRCSNTLLYLPKASMPHELIGPMLEVSLLDCGADNDPELAMHRTIYKNTPLKSILHCYISEVDAVALAALQNNASMPSKVIPIDVEGGFLYPSVPILALDSNPDDLCRAMLDYRMAIVPFGGVWAAGEQSIGEALRHVSSVKDICYYRIMAKMRGLDISAMEPDRAKSW